MAFEEVEHGGEQARLAERLAKPIGGQSGEAKEPLGAPFVGQRRGERGKRQRLGVICGR